MLSFDELCWKARPTAWSSAWRRAGGGELAMMSAIAQLRRNRPASPDPALLLAAVQAFPASLAIIASGLIVYANPAWCTMFDCPDASQLQERAVRDLLPTHSFSIVPGGEKPGAETDRPQKNDAQKNDAQKNAA